MPRMSELRDSRWGTFWRITGGNSQYVGAVVLKIFEGQFATVAPNAEGRPRAGDTFNADSPVEVEPITVMTRNGPPPPETQPMTGDPDLPMFVPAAPVPIPDLSTLRPGTVVNLPVDTYITAARTVVSSPVTTAGATVNVPVLTTTIAGIAATLDELESRSLSIVDDLDALIELADLRGEILAVLRAYQAGTQR